MHSRFSSWIAATALVLSPLPIAAHHGWAGNATEEFEITGTVGPRHPVGPPRDDEDPC